MPGTVSRNFEGCADASLRGVYIVETHIALDIFRLRSRVGTDSCIPLSRSMKSAVCNSYIGGNRSLYLGRTTVHNCSKPVGALRARTHSPYFPYMSNNLHRASTEEEPPTHHPPRLVYDRTRLNQRGTQRRIQRGGSMPDMSSEGIAKMRASQVGQTRIPHGSEPISSKFLGIPEV